MKISCDEFCANNGCVQANDCPARKPLTVAKVAKARPVMKAADPLPPSFWRQQLKYLAEWFLLGIVGVIWLLCLIAVVYFTFKAPEPEAALAPSSPTASNSFRHVE
jgi:hypothetical protein